MARKTLTREVTKTTVKLGRVVTENGVPQFESLEDIVLLGNVDAEKAQKQASKMFDFPVTVIEVQADTVVYQMPVEEFMKHATIREDGDESEQEVQA